MTSTGTLMIVARTPEGREVQYRRQVAPLGSGSCGTVYLATRLSETAPEVDPSTEPGDGDTSAEQTRSVAIKVTPTPKMKGYLAEEARVLDALQRDASQALRRSQTSVYRPIRIHSGPEPLTLVDDYHSALIELEYLDGVTLRAWLEEWRRREDLTPARIVDEVLLVAQELAEALVQISGPGNALIHRDVKPENIMRTSRGLRLIDFNVSRDQGERNYTQHVGTNGYMAPEVAGSTSYDARADLFSVGVILWETTFRRPFDLYQATEEVAGRRQMRWNADAWPVAEREVLAQLLPALVCDVSLRLPHAGELLQRVRALRDARQPAHAASPTGDLDMIELLSELKPSGLVSVVSATHARASGPSVQDFLRQRMQVEDPLEQWLLHEVIAAATRADGRPALFMLAGNAGDGKSHLLLRLRQQLASRPEVLERLVVIADATHALTPTASQSERLAVFFEPFADGASPRSGKVHLIAMNTGMVIRFFEEGAHASRFRTLYAELERQLGLRRGSDPSTAWRVDVVNLDLRDLISPPPGRSAFAERMLDRLDPEREDSIPAPLWPTCQACPAFALCPVAFNLRALRQPAPRRAVLRVLRRVALDADVHLSPRNLWGFLYGLVTGGSVRYERPVDGRRPCDGMRERADDPNSGAWLLEGQFTELLFQKPDPQAPWPALVRHDPACSGAREIDALHTRLSIKAELDQQPELLEPMGGQDGGVAGLALGVLSARLPRDASFKGRRRDAAVRRQVLFEPRLAEAWARADGGKDFEDLLDAWYAYSTQPLDRLSDRHREQLGDLRALVRDVMVYGHGRVVGDVRYLKVSQPNMRARSELLVRADDKALDELFEIRNLLEPDVHAQAHRTRSALLQALGYRPTQILLNVQGIRLTVDLALYTFLRRVRQGQKPSKREMSQFQVLLLIGERVANELAKPERTKEIHVWDADAETLHRLATDAFGKPRMNVVR